MSNNLHNENVVIDGDAMCEFIAKRLKLDADLVQDILDAELDYAEAHDDEQNGTASPELAEGLISYVAENADAPAKTVKSVLMAALDYLNGAGI